MIPQVFLVMNSSMVNDSVRFPTLIVFLFFFLQFLILFFVSQDFWLCIFPGEILGIFSIGHVGGSTRNGYTSLSFRLKVPISLSKHRIFDIARYSSKKKTYSRLNMLLFLFSFLFVNSPEKLDRWAQHLLWLWLQKTWWCFVLSLLVLYSFSESVICHLQ